jgi:hypothetical protein
MNMMSLIRKADNIQTLNTQSAAQEAAAKQAAKKAAALDRVTRILDEASADPEKFVRIVRTQMGREERQLFTYRQVRYRAQRGDSGAMALMEEYFRQERGEEITTADISDEQLELLWEAGVSIGRILSCNPMKLSDFYQGRGKEGAKPYVSVVHWARAYKVCKTLHLEAVANTLEEMMYGYYRKFFPCQEQGVDSLDKLAAEYETYHPDFLAVWNS